MRRVQSGTSSTSGEMELYPVISALETITANFTIIKYFDKRRMKMKTVCLVVTKGKISSMLYFVTQC